MTHFNALQVIINVTERPVLASQTYLHLIRIFPLNFSFNNMPPSSLLDAWQKGIPALDCAEPIRFSLKIWTVGPGMESCWSLTERLRSIWGCWKRHVSMSHSEVTGELRSHEETEKGGCREAPGTGTTLAWKADFAISGEWGSVVNFYFTLVVLGRTKHHFIRCLWILCAPLNPHKHPCYVFAWCNYVSVICNYKNLIRMEIGLRVLWLLF